MPTIKQLNDAMEALWTGDDLVNGDRGLREDIAKLSTETSRLTGGATVMVVEVDGSLSWVPVYGTSSS